MLMLSAELGNESSQPHVRNAAGLALKNALTAKVRESYPRILTSEIAPLMPLLSGKRPQRRIQQPLAGSTPRNAIKDQARLPPRSRIVREASRYRRRPVGSCDRHRRTSKWPVAGARRGPSQFHGPNQRQSSCGYFTSYRIHLRIDCTSDSL